MVRASLAAGSGVSALPDVGAAAAAAVSAAREALGGGGGGGGAESLALVAATADRDAAAVAAAVKDALGDTPFVGATSCAAVLTPTGPVSNGIGVLLLDAPPGSLVAAARPFGSDPGAARAAAEDAARELAEAAKDAGEVSLVYMIATPGEEEAVMAGVQAVFGEKVQIVGGSAADNDVSGSWSVHHNGSAFGTGVALFAVAGDGVKAGACLSSPYVPTKREVSVTAAEGRTIKELDGRPAAEVLLELVGDPLTGDDVNVLAVMSTRPYALRRGPDDFLAVHVASVDRDAGTVGLFAEARVGDVLVAMENEGGGDSAGAAGHAIRAAFSKAKANGGISKPAAGVLVYCGGLGIAVGDALGGNLTKDLAPIEDLPSAVIGFTAFGEQGPTGPASTLLANQHRNLSVGMALFE